MISPLFFIPPEPYPARHLPHAGKALAEGFVESTGGADELDFISDDVALGAAIHHTDGKDEGILRIVHTAR